MKFLSLLLVLFFISSSFAKLSICQLPIGMQDSIDWSLRENVLTEKEYNELIEKYNTQGCSAFDPYLHRVDYIFYGSSEMNGESGKIALKLENKTLLHFPNLKGVTIRTDQSQIPETLLHGLPHLTYARIEGDNIETIPTKLFAQNPQLLEFRIHSKVFRGISDSEFFKQIPLVQVLGLVPARGVNGNWPDDLCDHNKWLNVLLIGYEDGVNKFPSSCCYERQFQIFGEHGAIGAGGFDGLSKLCNSLKTLNRDPT